MKIEQNGSCLKIKGLQHQEALPSRFKKTKFSWVSYNNFSQLGPSAPFGLEQIFINSGQRLYQYNEDDFVSMFLLNNLVEIKNRNRKLS